MAIVFRFRLPALSKVTGKLRFALMDPEEKVVWTNSGTIDLLSQPTSQEHETAVSNMIFAFNRFRFATAGTYQLAAYWDEAQVASVPLFLLYPLEPGVPPGKGEVIWLKTGG